MAILEERSFLSAIKIKRCAESRIQIWLQSSNKQLLNIAFSLDWRWHSVSYLWCCHEYRTCIVISSPAHSKFKAVLSAIRKGWLQMPEPRWCYASWLHCILLWHHLCWTLQEDVNWHVLALSCARQHTMLVWKSIYIVIPTNAVHDKHLTSWIDKQRCSLIHCDASRLPVDEVDVLEDVIVLTSTAAAYAP